MCTGRNTADVHQDTMTYLVRGIYSDRTLRSGYGSQYIAGEQLSYRKVAYKSCVCGVGGRDLPSNLDGGCELASVQQRERVFASHIGVVRFDRVGARTT